MPTGFSGFAWGIAAFCLPILLWPMASLLSTSFVKNPTLSVAVREFWETQPLKVRIRKNPSFPILSEF